MENSNDTTFRFVAQYLNHCATISGTHYQPRRFVNKYGVTDNKRFTVYWSATAGTFEETVTLPP
jgi:hypothetical protein